MDHDELIRTGLSKEGQEHNGAQKSEGACNKRSFLLFSLWFRPSRNGEEPSVPRRR
jgi:hypothetical protein